MAGKTGSRMPRADLDELLDLVVPLPPLPEQQRIVAVLREQISTVERAQAAVTAQLAAAQALPAAYLRAVFDGPAAQDWPQVRLGNNVIKIGSGVTPRGGQSSYLQKGIPLIRSQNIHMNHFTYQGLAFISEEQDAQMSNSRVLPHDVLLNITGASIGRVCVVPDDLCPANVNQHVSIIRLKERIDPQFLSYFMSNLTFQKLIADTESGATRQALTKTQIDDFQIPAPPLPKQQAIAAVLAKQMAAATQIQYAIEAQLAAISAMPALLLRRAFAGELVPQQATIAITPWVGSMVDQAAAVGAYIVQHLQSQSWLGRVKFAKFQYLVEAWVGVPLSGHYHRAAYGPYDPQLTQLESVAERNGWFTVHHRETTKRTHYEYQPGPAIDTAVEAAIQTLGPHQPALDTLLHLLGSLSTRQVERIATLFAVWNDFLLDGQPPTDAALIAEFRTNWHMRKAHFTPEELQHDLHWMREHGLTPTGRGPHTENPHASLLDA